MEFGSRDRFAVSFELNEKHGSDALYGKFCYWIGHRQVGNYEAGTSLRQVLFQMKWVIADHGNRADDTLCQLPSEIAFVILDGSLYRNPEFEEDYSALVPEMPARFEVRTPMDAFDGWKLYLLACNQTETIMYKKLDDPSVSTFALQRGEFDSVLGEAYKALEAVYDGTVTDSQGHS